MSETEDRLRTEVIRLENENKELNQERMDLKVKCEMLEKDLLRAEGYSKGQEDMFGVFVDKVFDSEDDDLSSFIMRFRDE